MPFPLASGDAASLGLDERALDRLAETVTRHIAGRPLSRRAVRGGAPRQARPVHHRRRRAPRAAAGAGARRHPLAALLEHQGDHRLRGVDPGRARRPRLHRPHRRAPAGLRGQRQGRHHRPPAPQPSGGLPERDGAAGGVGRPRAAARGRCAASPWSGRRARALHYHGRDRPLDGGRAHRGHHQERLSRLHPRERHRAPGPGRRALRGRARRACTAGASTCTSRARTARARSSAPTRTPRPSGAPARPGGGRLRDGAGHGGLLPDAAWPAARSTACGCSRRARRST